MRLPNYKKAAAQHAAFVQVSPAGMPVRPGLINRRLASGIEDPERQRPRSVLRNTLPIESGPEHLADPA